MQTAYEPSWSRRLTVTTPEQVELRFETAGVGSRIGAQLIDMLIVMAANAGVALAGWAVYAAIGDAMPAWAAEYGVAALILFYAAFTSLYFIISEFSTGGRTVGKRAMGIRVIQENGRPLSFLSAVIRNLFRLIDMLPALYFTGILFSFFHSKDKRIGDWAAGTVVVFEQGGNKRKSKRIDKLLKDKAPFLPIFTFEPWMRERITEQEWTLLSAYVDRLHWLSSKKAGELGEGIVGLLAPKLELEAQWVELMQPAEEGTPMTAAEVHKRANRRKERETTPVYWALAMYSALREDWELQAEGLRADG
ncbi:RDD family protein [Paenibacillus thermotolerans]|uniref:RDD family protein n=1 Tax=Paenibacillus thermotolerans TaxID=3027807 RepID=UPI002368502B|nr:MULTISPECIES: RDD family protein [unclassified Paenibacillus]